MIEIREVHVKLPTAYKRADLGVVTRSLNDGGNWTITSIETWNGRHYAGAIIWMWRRVPWWTRVHRRLLGSKR